MRVDGDSGPRWQTPCLSGGGRDEAHDNGDRMTATLPSLFSIFGHVEVAPPPSPVRAQAQARLERLLGQPMRLGIVRALLAQGPLSFSELKRHVDITDGNLSMHARKLVDARLVTFTKAFRHRLPRTEYRLTPVGR